MRSIAPFALATIAILTLSAATALAKDDSHVTVPPAGTPDRQGGDTIAEAVTVELPFYRTGSTVGFTDDYDEVCPYVNSTSPDVVYTFTPDGDEYVDIDMHGSAYDTKIYLYDVNLALVACNDDFYSDYTSRLDNLSLVGGMQYYLVIDGYGGDAGDYVVSTCPNLPCDFGCSSTDVLEGEPDLVDGYVDTYNAGCDTDPPVFQLLLMPPGEDAIWFCGISGWYDTGGERRDSDWFEFVASGDEVSVHVMAPYTFSIDADVMYVQDCEDVSVLPYQLGSCGSGTIHIPTTPGQLVRLRVRPTTPTIAPCADAYDQYKLYITGIDGVVPVAETSWTAVRQLYR